VNPGAYRLISPSSYEAVQAMFNESALRPWLDKEGSRILSYVLPPGKAHPALNKAVQVLVRKSASVHLRIVMCWTSWLSISVRSDDSTEWIPRRRLTEPDDIKLLQEIDGRFPIRQKQGSAL
jgi:hypothetical protein